MKNMNVLIVELNERHWVQLMQGVKFTGPHKPYQAKSLEEMKERLDKSKKHPRDAFDLIVVGLECWECFSKEPGAEVLAALKEYGCDTPIAFWNLEPEKTEADGVFKHVRRAIDENYVDEPGKSDYAMYCLIHDVAHQQFLTEMGWR